MSITIRLALCAVCITTVLSSLSCSKEVTRNNGSGEIDLPLTDIDIEKRFLEEGFITDDLFRVVMVTTKDAFADMAALRTRASNRALVSLERSLSAENIQCDRNVKAAILSLIDRSGQLVKKEIDHKRYNVFYFDITRKNMVNYFRNIASQR
ncbi:MAG TPA: hypothetical protein PK307_01870 [Spirochaetota bacterium]|nr:hypothetical protein [Spirochaetota bacterium]HOD15336.1 hypothetical protein [Spirochaetota bacterium]HPG52358.1 hypothetical protein [Spirochaetota bacterium]HPN12743.1 hypothetical protein [Spirochaetota bacterium]HQL80922.1 hypothetical protein [Spirochaetota bacterium]